VCQFETVANDPKETRAQLRAVTSAAKLHLSVQLGADEVYTGRAQPFSHHPHFSLKGRAGESCCDYSACMPLMIRILVLPLSEIEVHGVDEIYKILSAPSPWRCRGRRRDASEQAASLQRRACTSCRVNRKLNTPSDCDCDCRWRLGGRLMLPRAGTKN
jgi:hypothetical protein